MPQAEYDVCLPRSRATISRLSSTRFACEAADIPAASAPTTTTRSLMGRGYGRQFHGVVEVSVRSPSRSRIGRLSGEASTCRNRKPRSAASSARLDTRAL